MGKDLRKFYIRYDSHKEIKKENSVVEVLYVSDDEISHDNYKIVHKDFCDYLNSDKTNDVISIVTHIKDMLKDFDEKKLIVEINAKGNYQYVSYENGIMDYCHLSKKVFDDIVSVANTPKGVNINYKKYEKHIQDEESIKSINNEINELMIKICKLRKLEKNKENEKTKKLEK